MRFDKKIAPQAHNVTVNQQDCTCMPTSKLWQHCHCMDSPSCVVPPSKTTRPKDTLARASDADTGTMTSSYINNKHDAWHAMPS
jgi:hypothetical protein